MNFLKIAKVNFFNVVHSTASNLQIRYIGAQKHQITLTKGCVLRNGKVEVGKIFQKGIWKSKVGW